MPLSEKNQFFSQYFIVKHALSHGVRAEDYRRLASEAASRLSPGEVLEAEARRREGRERERAVPVVLPLSDSLKGSLVRENTAYPCSTSLHCRGKGGLSSKAAENSAFLSYG